MWLVLMLFLSFLFFCVAGLDEPSDLQHAIACVPCSPFHKYASLTSNVAKEFGLEC